MLEAVAVAMVSVADAVLDMILQDYLGGIIERRAHRRKLDEHIGAVPPILKHMMETFKETGTTESFVDGMLSMKEYTHLLGIEREMEILG